MGRIRLEGVDGGQVATEEKYMTIDSSKIVRDILIRDGWTEDHFPLPCIYAYQGIDHKTHFALYESMNSVDVDTSPFVRGFEPLMLQHKITVMGQLFLNHEDHKFRWE